MISKILYQLCTQLLIMSIISLDCDSNRVNRLRNDAKKPTRSASGVQVEIFYDPENILPNSLEKKPGLADCFSAPAAGEAFCFLAGCAASGT